MVGVIGYSEYVRWMIPEFTRLVHLPVVRVVDGVEEVWIHCNQDGSNVGVDLVVYESGAERSKH